MFLDDKNKEIFKCLFGSNLYGTNTPESDMDFKSVHIPSRRSLVLQTAQDVISTNTKLNNSVKNSNEDVDIESFSLHKFVKLLERGDMVAVELLFVPDNNILMMSNEWRLILNNKFNLIDRKIQGFLGYCMKQASKYGIKGSRIATARTVLNILEMAHDSSKVYELADEIESFVEDSELSSILYIPQPSQVKLPHWEVIGRKIPFTISVKEAKAILQKIIDNVGQRALQAEKNEGVDWKAMAHAIRVGEQAEELLRYKTITFPRPNAKELIAIKRGSFSYKEVSARLENQLEKIHEAAKTTKLIQNIDKKLQEDIVYYQYLTHIENHLRT